MALMKPIAPVEMEVICETIIKLVDFEIRMYYSSKCHFNIVNADISQYPCTVSSDIYELVPENLSSNCGFGLDSLLVNHGLVATTYTSITSGHGRHSTLLCLVQAMFPKTARWSRLNGRPGVLCTG